MGVALDPGLIELTRILSGARSSARARVRLWIAPFEVAYAATPLLAGEALYRGEIDDGSAPTLLHLRYAEVAGR